MGRPLVSVCMPVYNGARFLESAIESVLAQTYSDFELRVFDDASTDGSWELLQGFRDPRLVLHRNDRNLGPEANWNQALEAARGTYIKLFHQDDLLAPDCLERQVRVLEDHPRVVLAFSRRHIIRPDGRRLLTRGAPWKAGPVSLDAVVRGCALAGTNVIGEPSAVLFTTAAARQAGGFDGSLPYVIDLDYWFRLLALGDGCYLDEPLASFRVSPRQWSATIGWRQGDEFATFLDRNAGAMRQGGGWLRVWGKARSHVNGILRVLVYRFIVGGA